MKYKNRFDLEENLNSPSTPIHLKKREKSSYLLVKVILFFLVVSFLVYHFLKLPYPFIYDNIYSNPIEFLYNNSTSYNQDPIISNNPPSSFSTTSQTTYSTSQTSYSTSQTKSPIKKNNPNTDFKYQFTPDYTDIEEELAKRYHTCEHDVWCNVPPPKESFFSHSKGEEFDMERWKRAQAMAASNDPILSMYISHNIFHKSDLLDGDIFFRKYHYLSDYFVSEKRTMSFLSDRGYDKSHVSVENEFLPRVENINTYDSNYPIIKFGYHHFNNKALGSSLKPSELFPMPFGGPFTSETIVNYPLMNKIIKNSFITKPWVGIHMSNENWGIFSTYVQNRTVEWGKCCNTKDPIFQALDSEHLKGFFIAQHHNISHPKVIIVPRGIPSNHFSRTIDIFNIMRYYGSSYKVENGYNLNNFKKDSFVFTSSSSWKPRIIIMDCLLNRFYTSKDRETHRKLLMKNLNNSYEFALNYLLVDSAQMNIPQEKYYHKIARSKFVLALPGLGYDTHRLWEAFTLGSIPIFERGVGYERTFWKLPVLLVDDYSEVNEDLLRQAYVEAMYRASEFEYFRLRQSFWTDIIGFTASSVYNKKGDFLSKVFPMKAEKENFVRPFHPCDNCIPGKITPKTYC